MTAARGLLQKDAAAQVMERRERGSSLAGGHRRGALPFQSHRGTGCLVGDRAGSRPRAIRERTGPSSVPQPQASCGQHPIRASFVANFAPPWVWPRYGRVRQVRPDIVHIHSSLAGVIVRICLLPVRRRPKLIYTPHAWSFSPGATRNVWFRRTCERVSH